MAPASRSVIAIIEIAAVDFVIDIDIGIGIGIDICIDIGIIDNRDIAG